MAAGDFSKTALVELQLHAESIWHDKVKKRDYNPDLATAKVIMEQQTADVTAFAEPSLDRQVSVNWVDFCQDTAVDDTEDEDPVSDDDTCEIDGTEAESKTELLDIDMFIKDSFKIQKEKLRGNFIKMQEVIATGLLGIERNIINKLNVRLNSRLLTFAGVNQYTGDIGNESGGYTEIPEANFTAEGFFPYLQQAGVINKFGSLLMLDGGNLFQDNYRSQKYLGNDDGKAAASMYGDLQYRNDLFGFAANGIQDVSIVLDPGSVAFANVNRFTPEHEVHQNPWKRVYTVASNYLPGVNYDVTFMEKCIDGKYWYFWEYKLRSGFWLNPLRCNEDVTGVLLFKKVA